MIQNIRSRANRKSVALVLTFGLLITGSGLASLASLSDTLTDTVQFNTLSVDLKDGAADSSAVTFSNINPAVGGSFSQDINLTNSGSASATVDLATAVTVGAGSDLDAALLSVVVDGTAANPGSPIVITPGPWLPIADVDTNFPTITLNAGQSKQINIQWSFAPNAEMDADTLTAIYTFTATHP